MLRISNLWSLTIVLILLLGCNQPSAQIQDNMDFKFPYKTKKPSKKYNLPKSLNEISGIAFIDKKTIAAIQDEKGILFLYALKKEEITSKLDFSKGHDYEGIAYDGSKISIVTSKGKLYSVQLENKVIKAAESKFIEQNGTANLEGICYDFKTKNYLLAYKEQTAFDSFNERSIYQYPFKSKVNRPFFSIGNQEIRSYIAKDTTNDKKLKQLKKQLAITKPSFYPSGIAIHPKSNDIYIVSGINELLIVVDYEGHFIKHIEFLDDDLLPQPEGITFDKNGTMYLSTEKNKNKKAYLYKYKQL